MIPIETIGLFLTASVALALVPGPDNIFVLMQSAIFGRKAGLQVTLGLCTGLIAHTLAVTLGVAVIFQTSTLAFNVLKFAGAIYLLYLAVQAFKSKPAHQEGQQYPSLSWRQLYLRGIIMNATNPKVAIFFLAFLPQFTNPALGSVTTQLLALGGLFIASSLLVFGLIAWFSGYLGEWFKASERAQVIMNRVAGTVFAGLALRLVVSER
ncbi:LysE family translocator [Sessilibacter corallicola]|uniref:LysE family translocator n=1 Tax=Sessilibacter corallicola TaxID=2904075 RepID=UPI001E44121F|nr:LysE family translocator [Sessilibacter corallicola]MCE2030285.1 LysE family translocator [Sessilibacter corallicola]